MSFILDALKKADKKRQESTAPSLDTMHDLRPKKLRSQQLWISILITILLLNIGLLVWFLSPEKQAPVVDVTPVQQSAVAVAELEPVAQSQPASVPQEKSVAMTQTKSVEQPLPKHAIPEPPPRQLNLEPANSQMGVRVYSIGELPVSVQQLIPELHMSLHAYSDTGGSAGMVRVNGQILRQGAMLEGKFLLEEIRADGAVFGFDGYYFLLPSR